MGKTTQKGGPFNLSTLRAQLPEPEYLKIKSGNSTSSPDLSQGYQRPPFLLDTVQLGTASISFSQACHLPPFSAVYPNAKAARQQQAQVLTRTADSDDSTLSLPDAATDENAMFADGHMHQMNVRLVDGRAQIDSTLPLLIARLDLLADGNWALSLAGYDAYKQKWLHVKSSDAIAQRLFSDSQSAQDEIGRIIQQVEEAVIFAQGQQASAMANLLAAA